MLKKELDLEKQKIQLESKCDDRSKEKKIWFGKSSAKCGNIQVDSAWKKDVRRGCPSAGIGWIGVMENGSRFKGNEKIKATSALQCEEIALLRGIREAYRMGIRDIHASMNSVQLINMLQSN